MKGLTSIIAKALMKISLVFLILIGGLDVAAAGTLNTSDTATLNKIGLPYNERSKKIEYSSVISVDGASKNEILSVAKETIKLFPEADHFYVVTDNQERLIYTVKSSFEVIYRKKSGNNVFHDIIFTIKVETKDGKYRYTITNFEVFDKEKNRIVGKSKVNIIGISTTHYAVNEVLETTPLEEFLSVDSRRKERAKIYNQFQDQMNDLINYLTANISEELSVDSDW